MITKVNSHSRKPETQQIEIIAAMLAHSSRIPYVAYFTNDTIRITLGNVIDIFRNSTATAAVALAFPNRKLINR